MKASHTTLAIIALAMSFILPSIIVYSIYSQGAPIEPNQTITEDYTGKVIQVDHPTTTSSGFLFFGSSSRTDTYVTFDNGQTYWKQGYEAIIEGHTYQVHTVKTIQHGTGLNATGLFEQGSVTTIVNTFTEVTKP